MNTRETGKREARQWGKLEQTDDYLHYLADLISELKKMAEKADTPTLAGLLDLAHMEAKIQGKKGRKNSA